MATSAAIPALIKLLFPIWYLRNDLADRARPSIYLLDGWFGVKEHVVSVNLLNDWLHIGCVGAKLYCWLPYHQYIYDSCPVDFKIIIARFRINGWSGGLSFRGILIPGQQLLDSCKIDRFCLVTCYSIADPYDVFGKRSFTVGHSWRSKFDEVLLKPFSSFSLFRFPAVIIVDMCSVCIRTPDHGDPIHMGVIFRVIYLVFMFYVLECESLALLNALSSSII